jgi:hypothetical protein
MRGTAQEESRVRVGKNPMKGTPTGYSAGRHRVIVPVYVPAEGDYYRDAHAVTEVCLRSLIDSVAHRDDVRITVVNNGSRKETTALLRSLLDRGALDQVVDNVQNVGKPDAVIAAARASFEPFVTLTDADVLFHWRWLREVESVFSAFPPAGCVSPSPAPFSRHYHTSSAWLFGAKTRSLRCGPACSPEDLERRARSVGKGLKAHDRAAQFHLASGETKALIGCGHFVYTLRRRVFDDFPYEPVGRGLGFGRIGLDEHIDRLGMLRLSTTTAFAEHLGNTLDREVLTVPDDADRAAGGAPVPAEGLAIGHVVRTPHGVRKRVHSQLVKPLELWLRIAARRADSVSTAAPLFYDRPRQLSDAR